VVLGPDEGRADEAAVVGARVEDGEAETEAEAEPEGVPATGDAAPELVGAATFCG
jgi:hypothetical protein